jgi:hypothetical protein
LRFFFDCRVSPSRSSTLAHPSTRSQHTLGLTRHLAHSNSQHTFGSSASPCTHTHTSSAHAWGAQVVAAMHYVAWENAIMSRLFIRRLLRRLAQSDGQSITPPTTHHTPLVTTDHQSPNSHSPSATDHPSLAPTTNQRSSPHIYHRLRRQCPASITNLQILFSA